MNEDIQLALIVTLLALGASVLIGVLGYLVNKNGDSMDQKSKENGA
ncbi:MAG TPA: hypothetical protein VGN17_05735 [Bryobacteraceae bacterium]|jgi:hypothetical protein